MTAIICGSAYVYRRRILPCQGQCAGKRRRVVVAEGSPWYAPTLHCVHCGDSWSDGWLMPRPFRRGWRAEAITEHRALWDTARSGPIERDDDMWPIPDGCAA